MMVIPILVSALCIALLVILYLIFQFHQTRKQLFIIEDALEDIKAGNRNRRVLAKKSALTKKICYSLNEITTNSQEQLIRQKQSEQAYKRLMTSLSHDVKTPLTSLIGYLDAVESGLVTGEEQKEYIHIATEKSYQLKRFIEALFEWVKLDAGEQIFHFEVQDLNELTRNILAEWIPVFENHHFEYEIEIPESVCEVRVDSQAYTRILNNIFQNALSHSGGDLLRVRMIERNCQVQISVSDNGRGILAKDLPHIFERLYQGASSGVSEGNGLGLAIAKELVNVHQGTIHVDSQPESGANFIITLPKVQR